MINPQILCLSQPKLIVEKAISSTGKFNVFLARSSTSAQKYVVKAFSKDEYSYYFFAREKRVHSSLSHTNIIQYVPDYLFQIDISQFNVILMDYAQYGDFFNLILDFDFADEKLIRTYFHQLIEGLKYLHSRGIAHLDLKLENILLGSDFQLKIADFDLAQSVKDKNLISQGTANYRARELWSGSCQDYFAADVYSAGICLYTLLTGAFPFMEEGERKSGTIFRYDTFVEKNEQFWAENADLIGEKINFSQSLKDLLNKMWTPNPSERISLDEIMNSSWYNEPIYTSEELTTEIKKVLML